MPIKFYREGDLPYGVFSNFSPHGLDLNGQFWRTAEHYFQAQKFESGEAREQIRLAKSPMDAKILGNARTFPLRADWNAVKDAVMLAAVRAKFAQHADIRETLLGTGEAELIEDAKNDAYWGSGADGTGRNQLGKTLMQVRDELKKYKTTQDKV